MKLVAGSVFYNCKGQPYLALLLPIQRKSNTFSTTTFFILNSNKFYSGKDQSPINQSLNITSRMTLTVLDLNADSENCFSLFLT